MIADAEAVNGRKNFIVIVLKDNLQIKDMPQELKTYMKTYTYIDATRNTDKLIKRLRYVGYSYFYHKAIQLKLGQLGIYYYNLHFRPITDIFKLSFSVIHEYTTVVLFRFSMPFIPLRDLKPDLFEDEHDSDIELLTLESDTESEEQEAEIGGKNYVVSI